MASGAIKIAAISGSIRKASSNSGLLRAAARLAPVGMEIQLVDISELPVFNADLLVDGKWPESVEKFRTAVAAADALLLATTEYNYSVSAPLKNALDWGSIRGPPADASVFTGKPCALVSSGGGLGGLRAQYHMRQIGVFLDLHVLNKPEVGVRRFSGPIFDEDTGDLRDEETEVKIKELLEAFAPFVKKINAAV
mmetsp:Transcript_10543/g.28036  ORF Transcript_10543/g.28036 Transcript_10543/m.28036 type:complete len:195 (-) Transcript_10543:344-928(-)